MEKVISWSLGLSIRDALSVRASWEVHRMPRWDGSNERFLCSIVLEQHKVCVRPSEKDKGSQNRRYETEGSQAGSPACQQL